MFVKIVISLLFKKSKHWLMPLCVVVFSVFLLFQQFGALRSVRAPVEALCKGGDLWMTGGADDLMKVRRLNDVKDVSFIEPHFAAISVPLGPSEGKLSCPAQQSLRKTNLDPSGARGSQGHMAIKAYPRANLVSLKGKVERATGKHAFTRVEFTKELFKAHMKGDKTLSLFGIAVMSGLVFTLGIFGATFYYFFKREIPNYSVMIAVGVDPRRVWALIAFQSVMIAVIGWGLAFVLYMILQTISPLFFPLSLSIIWITFGSLLTVSLVSATLVSSRVKYDRM